MESFEEMLQVYLSRAPSPSIAKSARTHTQAHPVTQTHESLSFSLSVFLSFSLILSLTPSCAREQRMQMEHSKEMQNQFAFGLDGREQGNKVYVCVFLHVRARVRV